MAITNGARIQHVFGTLAQYEALKAAGSLLATDLYFITDTKQIYVGEDLYTGQVQFVSEFPTTPSQGIIYVNGTTHETKVWNGSAWQVMIPAIKSDIATAADTDLVNAKAIKDYLAGLTTEAILDVAYSEVTQKFTITYADATTSELALKNLLTGASYNAETAEFTFTVANGDAVTFNIPKENFLSTATFDEATHVLTLTLVDGTEVPVDLKELVDTYTVKSTATVELAMSATGEITANVKKSATEGNALVLNTDGLFVPEALVKSVADTSTVNVEVSEDGELTAEVKISATSGNKLTANEDGLFVAETDLSGYYNKTQVDNALALKANASDVYTKSEVYTKGEVDTELGKKADQATTYTKTEVDTELGKKANSADVYTKSEVYTKEEANAELAKKANASDVYTKSEVDGFTTWKAMV